MRAQLLSVLAASFFMLQTSCATKANLNLQANCAASQFPTQLDMAGSLDGVAGEYRDGTRSISLIQRGYGVFAVDGLSERQLRRLAEWRFEDGCGTTYQLSFPLAGVGASVDVIDQDGNSTRLQSVPHALN